MGPIQSLTDFLSMVWRRLPLILTVLIIGLLVSLYLAVTSPPSFEARSVIQVNAPIIADPVTRSAPPASLRVQQIEQRLRSRENILRLIDRYDLFADVPAMPESSKITAVRADIRIESVAASAGAIDSTSSLSSIVISAVGGTAETAAGIANDLANDVVTSDRRDREARIVEADDFLTAELRRIESELDRRAREIAAFASENEDALPEARAYQQQELIGLTQRETMIEQSLMDLRRERLVLQREATADTSDSVVEQLRSAEVALARARRTLPASHPEIRRLEETISGLTRGESGDDATGFGSQMNLIDSQIATVEGNMAEIYARRTEIEQAQSRAPQVMQTYQEMQRSRQNLDDQYAEFSRRLAEIDALRLLSDNDQTENMVILERAIPPEFPLASNRRRSAILGAFLSVTVALGLALILEFMNPVLRNVQQFEAVTGLRPLVALPYHPTRHESSRERGWQIYTISIAVIGLLIALWMLDFLPQWLADILPPSVRAGGAD